MRGPFGLFRRRAPVRYAVVMIVGSVVSTVARREVPLTLGASPFDGGLYVRLAASLYRGHWLGAFDNRTLARGPAYPAFVATVRTLHVHLQVAQQLTWLLAALGMAGCVWMATRRAGLAVIVYLFLAFDPDNFGAAAAGVWRDGWYASLSILVIATWFLAVHSSLTTIRLRWVVALAAAAGLSTALFWLCREEGPWIIPGLAVLALGLPLLWRLRRERGSQPVGTTRRFVRWWPPSRRRRISR